MSLQNRFDVSVIGGIGYDTNCYLYSDKIDFSIEVNFTSNKDCIGGAGGYSSISFTNLGLKTAFIGFIGKDQYGKQIEAELNEHNIDTSCLFTDPHGTKRSVNIVYNDGRRKNFYDAKGAMEIQIDAKKVEEILSRSKLAHFSIVNWTREILPVAKKLGLIISTDIQDVVHIEDEYRYDFLNYSEIVFFSTINIYDQIKFINEYFSRFPNIELIIAGNGDKGCIIGTKQGIEKYPPPDINLKVTDTNGAGDSLATGFLSSYYFDGYNIPESIFRAQINARYTCSLNSEPANMLAINELDRLHAKYKP